MAKAKYPSTPAIRLLRSRRIDFKPHIYTYADNGGAGQAAGALNVSLHRVVKTLVMETEDHFPLLVLMHGDRSVSTKRLARMIGVKRIEPVKPKDALRHTGYQVGGISPFGTRSTLTVYVQSTIVELESILVNGGKRGFLVEIDPAVLEELLPAVLVNVAVTA